MEKHVKKELVFNVNAMEKERIVSGKKPAKRQLTNRGIEPSNSSQHKSNSSFKRTARQVWMANLLAKQRTTELTIKPAENIENKELNVEVSARPPSVKRKGTPEIFPMSIEMRRTILLLGNLDLLPEEERFQQTDHTERQKMNKFKLTTRQRIIQPQRFLRGMKNVTDKKLTSPKEEACINDDNLFVEQDKISEETGFVDNDEQHDNAFEKSENENPSLEKEEMNGAEKMEGNSKRNKPSRVSSSHGHKKSSKNAWSKSMKIYQSVYTLSNPTRRTNFNRNYSNLRTPTARKYHCPSKSWQADESLELRNFPIRRAFSLGAGKAPITEEQLNNDGDITREGRTVGEIADDIQLRCSKWFEFRQKILKHRDEK